MQEAPLMSYWSRRTRATIEKTVKYQDLRATRRCSSRAATEVTEAIEHGNWGMTRAPERESNPISVTSVTSVAAITEHLRSMVASTRGTELGCGSLARSLALAA